MANAFIECCPPGKNMTLYYNTGDLSTPVWIEHAGIIDDLNMPETEDVQELSGRRLDRLVREYNQGDIEVSVNGTQICDPNYEGWQRFYAARNGGKPVHAACLTNRMGNTCCTGWAGNWWNSDRSFNGPQTGNLTSVVNLQPASPCLAIADGDNDPVHTVRSEVDGTIQEWDATEPYPVPGP